MFHLLTWTQLWFFYLLLSLYFPTKRDKNEATRLCQSWIKHQQAVSIQESNVWVVMFLINWFPQSKSCIDAIKVSKWKCLGSDMNEVAELYYVCTNCNEKVIRIISCSYKKHINLWLINGLRNLFHSNLTLANIMATTRWIHILMMLNTRALHQYSYYYL